MSREPLALVYDPHPALKTVARPVTRFGRSIDAIANEMLRLMREHDGVGLAANQVGVTLRIIVADDGKDRYVLVNPKIIASEGSDLGVEGCLSQPGILCAVECAQRIRVKAATTHGKPFFLRAEGLLARIIQHEVSHLDGLLLTDRGTRVEPAKEATADAS